MPTPAEIEALEGMGYRLSSGGGADWVKLGADFAPCEMLWWTGAGNRWVASLPGKSATLDGVIAAAVWASVAAGDV